MFFLLVLFGVLLPVAANGLPISPEHNTLMPATDHSLMNIPDGTIETYSEGLLEILAGFIAKEDLPPSDVGELTEISSSFDVSAKLGEPLTVRERQTTTHKSQRKTTHKSPALKVQKVNLNVPDDKSSKPPDAKPHGNLETTLSIIFFVLVVLLYLLDVVRFFRRTIRSNAEAAPSLTEGEPATVEPPLTLTFRVWMSISSLFGPKESLSPPQMSPGCDDKAVSTKSEKISGRKIFSWRPWKSAQRIIPPNNPVLDTVLRTEVPLNQIDPPLEEVVCHHVESFNHQATNKPCYTGSGLTEVSVD